MKKKMLKRIGLIIESLLAIMIGIFIAIFLFVLAVNVESILLAVVYTLSGVFVLGYIYTYSVQGLDGYGDGRNRVNIPRECLKLYYEWSLPWMGGIE